LSPNSKTPIPFIPLNLVRASYKPECFLSLYLSVCSISPEIKNLVLAFKTRVLGDLGLFEAETCLDTQLTQLDNQGVLDSASLVITPNGYKEGLLYSVVPSKVGTNLLLRRTCSATSDFSPCEVSSSDNINGIEVSTNGDVITIRARNDSNTFYGSGISYTALNPNKGYKSGVIFAGGSNYLESSLVQDISIVGQ
jgi:hypothetical protein